MYFCRNSNFGGTRGPFTERPRELHSKTQRRRWPRNLRLFLLPLSFSFFLSFSPFVLPLAPRGAGGAAKSGRGGGLPRRAASDRGPWMGPMPCAWLGGLP